MQRLEVSGAVLPIYGSLGVKRLTADQASQIPRLLWIQAVYILFCFPLFIS